MSSIVFKNLEQDQKGLYDWTFKDIYLDIEEATVVIDGVRPAPKSKDIKVAFDEGAIKNSIVNIFNTKKGERFLIPPFGANLYAYLFEPITDFTAKMIGQTMLDAIRIWEPRVKVDEIIIIAKPDEHEYGVTIKLLIPKLKYRADLTGVLTTEGFREI